MNGGGKQFSPSAEGRAKFPPQFYLTVVSSRVKPYFIACSHHPPLVHHNAFRPGWHRQTTQRHRRLVEDIEPTFANSGFTSSIARETGWRTCALREQKIRQNMAFLNEQQKMILDPAVSIQLHG